MNIYPKLSLAPAQRTWNPQSYLCGPNCPKYKGGYEHLATQANFPRYLEGFCCSYDMWNVTPDSCVSLCIATRKQT